MAMCPQCGGELEQSVWTDWCPNCGYEQGYTRSEDPRKTGLKNGLRQLTNEQLVRVIEWPGDMILDEYNYADGKFCPLAIGVGLDSMPDPTHDKILAELIRLGYSVYNTRSIPGIFYTRDRKEDLLVAAREVLSERSWNLHGAQ